MNSLRTPVLLLFVALSFSTALAASRPVRPSDAAAADTLFAHQDWKRAAVEYRRALKSAPTDVRLWSRLATAANSAGDYAGASLAWVKADSLLPSPVFRYNLACARALDHQPAAAFEALRGAVALGFLRTQAFSTDPDLASLRERPEWSEFLAEVRKTSHPCEQDPAFREFDFWVGDWNVFNAQGQRAGSSLIERMDGDCAIFEHWQGALGDTGISLNTRDGVEGAWRQMWVDQRGRVSMFTGHVRDGAMHYEGYRQGPNGQRIPARMTISKISDDEVRQLGENSSDGGATWTVGYDFTYRRRK